MRIAFGCDHAGIDYKGRIIEYIKGLKIDVLDLGCTDRSGCDYPDIAVSVARLVSSGECDRGILICGTGVGMSITANKFKNIRAGVCWNEGVARLISEHNNANILCLPARFASAKDMVTWIQIWLDTPFSSEERHIRRVDKIAQLEKEGV